MGSAKATVAAFEHGITRSWEFNVPKPFGVNLYFSLIVDNPADFDLTLALNKPKTYPFFVYVDNQL
ncbi:hypothetical protein [Alishewanella jeotgali]|uniref:Uncharacterized protein n=1 Tax=Alishewanella jeotgali KCTC 22429 TaxID=1129374 RepID=H3ZJ39_9ALTE|nr:hypothetical protein [Alishewanella jeotgali]EHR39508.1 hypothetical protein AJE_17034 [Alishewanella jeotgali KCTC 22429]